PVIVSTRGTGRFPTDQAGGRIESGTYYETTFTDYNGAGGDQRHGIMIIDTAARTFNVAEGAVDGHASITLATFRTSGSDLVLSPDCGNNGTSRTLRYTSDRGVITIYNPTSNVTTYTKQ
ncbi:MAG TPA: hypothetical protein VMI54_19650, partial [Polyangiaceae bacterium]|nr:hypothetical protein [Polyangiaceae bacterium]